MQKLTRRPMPILALQTTLLLEHLLTRKLLLRVLCIRIYAGADDFGGTLIEENISKSAGSSSGQYLPSSEIIRLIKDAGRIPAQRTTTYEILKTFTN